MKFLILYPKNLKSRLLGLANVKFSSCLGIAVFFLISHLFALDSVLQSRLKNAANNDYIVTESNQMISLLAIREITPNSLILEEISAPAQMERPDSWSKWVETKAPGHSSWSMIEIDLETHQLLECYSFSRSAWIQLASQESLISTLLGLNLKKVPEEEQRHIGPPPMNGEPDLRKIWKPSFVENGKKQTDISFEVYHADWPQDGSELAGNRVCLYFDHLNHCSFPVWIQIDTSHLSASLRVIDSGKNLSIIHHNLPRRIPEFVGLPQKTANGLYFHLKSPKYYHRFELFAIDVTHQDKQICPINHSLIPEEGEMVQIEIPQTELENVLKPEHRYTWLIVPNGHNAYYAESSKPFVFNATTCRNPATSEADQSKLFDNEGSGKELLLKEEFFKD